MTDKINSIIFEVYIIALRKKKQKICQSVISVKGVLSMEDKLEKLTKMASLPLRERLEYLIAVGIYLKPDPKFGFVIKPILTRWSDIKTYNREKSCLGEYGDELISILKRL